MNMWKPKLYLSVLVLTLSACGGPEDGPAEAEQTDLQEEEAALTGCRVTTYLFRMSANGHDYVATYAQATCGSRGRLQMSAHLTNRSLNRTTGSDVTCADALTCRTNTIKLLNPSGAQLFVAFGGLFRNGKDAGHDSKAAYY